MSLRSIQVNPDLQPATWDEIKYYRDLFEVSPITLDDGREFDYDEKAMVRMERSVNHWAAAQKETDGTLGWKLLDNSYTFATEAQLTAIKAELDNKLTERASILHVKAEVFKLTSATLGTVKELSNWLS